MITTVKVTEKHVLKGCLCNCSRCPIARAINDLLKPKFQSRVTGKLRFVSRMPGLLPRWQYEPGETNLPEAAREFINEFDAENDVKPVEFEIDIPKRYLKGQ